MASILKWFWNILVALDQLLNAILLGDPDETVSSRCGKKRDCILCGWLCWFLNKLDTNHCKDSIEEDEGKDAVK